ncbi:MAG: prolyl oligopeptidase family serine peptidase, partial [bacterium]
KSLVLWSAVAHPAENFQKYLEELSKVHINDQHWLVDNGGFAIGDKFFDTLPVIKPLKVVALFTGPALIIHGKKDVSVPLSSAYEYRNVLNAREGATVELHIVENADHVFSSIPLTNQVINKTVDWFEKTLK